jgi:hypothetical protein
VGTIRSAELSRSTRSDGQPDLLDQPRRHRDDLLREAAAVDRGESALMAAQREGVLLGPRDLRLARMVLRDESRAEVHVGVAVHQRRVRRDLVAAHRHEAHRLGPAGKDRRREAAHDVLGGVGNRLQPGRAEAVHRDR